MKRTIKQRGSITVFLALILTLLFSFVLTMLEAARISAANAYVSMLSSLTADSFLATYYFPLFEEYGLLGVDAGYGTTALQYSYIEENLKEPIAYAADSLQDGILSMTVSGVTAANHKTLLSGKGEEFLRQVKQQTVYEGTEFALEQLFDFALLKDSATAGEIYGKQEEMQKEAANTVTELLKLMTLIDGVATGKQEIKFTMEGKPQTAGTFIKQLAPLSESELKEAFGNEQIFNALQSSFLYPQLLGSRVEEQIKEAMAAEETLAGLYASVDRSRETLRELETQREETEQKQKQWEKEAKQAKTEKDEERYEKAEKEIDRCKTAIHLLEEEAQIRRAEEEEFWKEIGEEEETRKRAVGEARERYETIRETVKDVLVLFDQAEKVVDVLEQKQQTAQAALITYELFLKEKEETFSSKLYEVFQNELETMKLYLGMEEQGYVPAVMRESLRKDRELLSDLALPEFQAGDLKTTLENIRRFTDGIGSYALDGLWFSYGDISAGQESGGNITDALSDLLGRKVCEMAGIPEEKLSKSEVSGQQLPSAALEQSPFYESLLECITQMAERFSGDGLATLFSETADAVGDTLALEIYLSMFFSNYQNQKENTRLAYEREYILFGKKSDAENMTMVVMSLTAFRSLFTMTALLQNTEKQAQLSALAQTAAGVVGLPILVAVIKYSLLLLWAVEEAFVETAALLAGKRIPFFSAEGTVSIGELFAFSKELVAKKADRISNSTIGTSYQDYLLLFSLLENNTKKCYMAMDLIQENIRMRYRDSFRIRNVVTGVSFDAEAELKNKWFPELFSGVYQIKQSKEICYQ